MRSFGVLGWASSTGTSDTGWRESPTRSGHITLERCAKLTTVAAAEVNKNRRRPISPELRPSRAAVMF